MNVYEQLDDRLLMAADVVGPVAETVEAAEAAEVVTVELVNGDLLIQGTSQDDLVQVADRGVNLEVRVRGEQIGTVTRWGREYPIYEYDYYNFAESSVDKIYADLGDGNDYFFAYDLHVPTWINGGAGNDTLHGGESRDILYGGSGDDILLGHGGSDLLFGQGGYDQLMGGSGYDHYFGTYGDSIYGYSWYGDRIWNGYWANYYEDYFWSGPLA